MMRIHPRIQALRRYAASREQFGGRQGRRIRGHLKGCGRCRELLDWSESIVEDARAATQLFATDESWQRIAGRAGEGQVVVLPAATPDRASRRTGGGEATGIWSRSTIRAALFVLVLAGGASALVPGSAVRAWLSDMVSKADGPAFPAVGPSAEGFPGSTSFVVPTGETPVRVVLHRPDAALVLRVRSGPPGELLVEATGAAARARFVRSRFRLDIMDAGAGEILLVLPERDEVRVNLEDRPLLWQESGRMIVPTPGADSAGSELVIRLGNVSSSPGAR